MVMGAGRWCWNVMKSRSNTLWMRRRKHTLGGVFFRLVRDQGSEAERRAIWPYPSWQQRKHRAKAPLYPPQHHYFPSRGSRQTRSF